MATNMIRSVQSRQRRSPRNPQSQGGGLPAIPSRQEAVSTLAAFNQANPGETYKLGSLIRPPTQVSGDAFGANIQLSGPPEFPARPTSVAGALMQAGPDDREAIGEALGRILSFWDATNAGIDPGLEAQQRALLGLQQDRLREIPQQPIDIYKRIDPTPINARHLMDLAFLSARKPAINPIAEPTPFPIPVPQNLPIPFPVGGGFPVPPPGGGGPTGATGGNVNIKIGGSTATSGRYGGGSSGGTTVVNNNGRGYQRNPNYGGNQGGGTQQPPSTGGGGTQRPGYGGGNTGGGGGYNGGNNGGVVQPGQEDGTYGTWWFPPGLDPENPNGANPPNDDMLPWWLSYAGEMADIPIDPSIQYQREIAEVDRMLANGEINAWRATTLKEQINARYKELRKRFER